MHGTEDTPNGKRLNLKPTFVCVSITTNFLESSCRERYVLVGLTHIQFVKTFPSARIANNTWDGVFLQFGWLVDCNLEIFIATKTIVAWVSAPVL